MTPKSGQETVTIHIFSNISRCKGNQAMKFDQVMEYNKRNIFLQKPCNKLAKEASSRPLFVFQKSLNLDKNK